MNTEISDDMVAAVDDTADFMHQQPPFVFAPSGITFGKPKAVKLFKGLITARSHGITITGREQGEADAQRRDSIRRGGR